MENEEYFATFCLVVYISLFLFGAAQLGLLRGWDSGLLPWDETFIGDAIFTLTSCSVCLVLSVAVEGLIAAGMIRSPSGEHKRVLHVPSSNQSGWAQGLLWATERLAAGMAGTAAMVLYARCGDLLGGIGFYSGLTVMLFVILPRVCFALTRYIVSAFSYCDNGAA